MKNPSHILLDRTTILVGDVFDRMAELPTESFDCVMFSPPYWGLRDYGTGEWEGGDPNCDHVADQRPPVVGSSSTLGFGSDGGPRRIGEGNQYHQAYRKRFVGVCGKCGAHRIDGQIGLEPTLAEHLDVMVRVMREVRRVLKKTGTVFLNYGDCYATAPNGMKAAETKRRGKDDRTFRDKPFSTVQGVLKPKDLCMVPNRLAIALQEDGWWVRSEIVWAKPNPMPESVTDRPATAHEKIWMLTKSARYFYNADAVRVEAADSSERRWLQNIDYQAGSTRAHGGGIKTVKPLGGPHAARKKPAGWDHEVTGRRHTSANAQARQIAERSDKQTKTAEHMPGSRGASDVAEPRHAGHINHTGIEDTPRGSRALRNYEPPPFQVWVIASQPFSEEHFATFPPELVERCLLAGCPPGGKVLDPFGGAGTTALVAAYMGMSPTMIELSEKSVAITRKRLVAEVSRVEPQMHRNRPERREPTTDFFED